MTIPNKMNGTKTFNTEEIFPTENDVVSGRGSGANRHKGNANFRELVRRNKQLYLRMSKKDKMKVAVSIYDHIASLSPPGRFLNKNPETEKWFETTRQRALEKISQALREKTASDRNKAAPAEKAEMTLPCIPPITTSMNSPSDCNRIEFEMQREIGYSNSRNGNRTQYQERFVIPNSPGARISSSYSQPNSSHTIPLRMPETIEMNYQAAPPRKDFLPPVDDKPLEYPLSVPQPSWHKKPSGNSSISKASNHNHVTPPKGLKRKVTSTAPIFIPQPPLLSLHRDGTYTTSRQDRMIQSPQMYQSPRSIMNSPAQHSLGQYEGPAFEVEEDPPRRKMRRLPIAPAMKKRNSRILRSQQQRIGVAEISLSGSSSSSSAEDYESISTVSQDSSIPEFVVKEDSSKTRNSEEKTIPMQVQLLGAGGLEALSVAASLISRN